MRQPARSNLIVVAVLALCASFGGMSRAWADDPRIEARTHYQAGVKFYGGGDYKAAIKEFSSAQQLAPADLNNYNLALCYDKLGDAEPAIQYYKEYLAKVPDAPKRSEIEASVARLEGALKSSAAKRADEQKKIDDAKKADDAKAADAAKVDPKRVDGAIHTPKGPTGPAVPPADVGPAVGPTIGVGSTGTPSTGQAVATGDAQLDRVSSINIDSIRDQRIGAASSGIPDGRGGPATGQPNAAGGPQPNGMVAGANGPNGPNGPNAAGAPANGQTPPEKPAPQDSPIYKKWWFWAVVAVSAYVVYEIATQGSQSSNTVGHETLPLNSPGRGIESGGVTLLHF